MVDEKLVILGSSGHAKIVIDILEKIRKYDILGVVTNDNMKTFMNYPVLGNDIILPKLYKDGISNVVMGIGGYRNNDLRKKVYNNIKGIGFSFISVIDPSATISKNVIIGEGAVIFAGVVINTEVVIGNDVIIATGSTIDHETIIKDHVLVSAGVTVGANDIIEDEVLLALGSNIISGIRISKNVTIGAGSVVTKDINEPGIYLGIPAKKFK